MIQNKMAFVSKSILFTSMRVKSKITGSVGANIWPFLYDFSWSMLELTVVVF